MGVFQTREDELRIAAAMVIFVLLGLVVEHGVSSALQLSRDGSDPLCPNLCGSRSDPLMDPFYEVRYGQDVVWQVPENPQAVLFIGHGKDKEPLSYFDPGANCEQCYGFPEDRAVVLEALKRSYAVILVKSVGTYWLPWNVESWPPEMSPDRVIVTRIINEWTKEHSLENLPLAALGFSSGGNFSTLLTLDLKIRSLVLMCTPGEFQVLERADGRFPPTLYAPMPADSDHFYPMIVRAIEILRSRGVRLAEYDLLPRPISPLYFTERIPCLDNATSEKIFAAYKAEKWLDENDYLVLNPAFDDWKGVLLKWKAVPYCEATGEFCFTHDVKQELSVAVAEHSFTSLADDVVFGWFDSTLFPPSDLFLRTTDSF